MKCIAIILIVLGYVRGHGRLMQPPSRASMWRFGFDNPRDDTDNEGNCGGRSVSFSTLYSKSVLENFIHILASNTVGW